MSFQRGHHVRALSFTPTSTLLLASLREQSDGPAWEDLLNRYRPVLLGFCWAAGLSPQDAEDVAQDTLAEFVRDYRAGGYKRDKGRLRGWLMGIARHRLIDLQRCAGVRRDWCGESAIADVHDTARLTSMWDEAQRRAVLEQALDLLHTQTHLAEASIRAFELVVLRGVPTAEVARQCGMSEAQVYVAKNRVASRLRELVAELASAYESDR
jgi:RNA polymerase sigma-70 factor (ECF subfamily)